MYFRCEAVQHFLCVAVFFVHSDLNEPVGIFFFSFGGGLPLELSQFIVALINLPSLKRETEIR